MPDVPAVRIAVPHSHLFADPASAEAILASADMVEVRRPEQAAQARGPVLYHAEHSLVAPWDGSQAEDVARVAQAADLAGLSLHVPSRFERNGLEAGAYVGVGEPMSRTQMLDNAEANTVALRAVMGPDRPIMVENNNHLGTDAYDTVTDPAFLNGLMDRCGLSLLWDVAHSRITAANTGRNEDDYIEALGLGRCLQVHLSRHGRLGSRAVDTHEALEDDDWEFFSARLAGLPALAFATVEYYADTRQLVAQMERLRAVLAAAGRGEQA